MIKTFKNKDLKELFETGTTSKINQTFHKRVLARLDALDNAATLNDLSLPSFKTHPLNGFDPTRYAISVNGPWRITFEFADGEVFEVDFEQYH